MSKGLIPYYFKTKDRLVLRTMEWILSIVLTESGEASAGSHPEEKVVAMLDVVFAGPEQPPLYLTYLDLLDHAARVDGFGQLSAAFRSTVNSLYAEVIRLGRDEGAFRVQDVDEAATIVRAIVDGLAAASPALPCHLQARRADVPERRAGRRLMGATGSARTGWRLYVLQAERRMKV